MQLAKIQKQTLFLNLYITELLPLYVPLKVLLEITKKGYSFLNFYTNSEVKDVN